MAYAVRVSTNEGDSASDVLADLSAVRAWIAVDATEDVDPELDDEELRRLSDDLGGLSDDGGEVRGSDAWKVVYYVTRV